MQSREPPPFTPPAARTSRHPDSIIGRGVIVNLGSVNSIIANLGNSAYVTANHAIVAASKVAALDLAKDLIRVNVVLPGGTDTPMLASTIKRWPEFRQNLIDRTPLRRLASTDEIANTIVHLCSSAASFITDSTIVIDGGLTARL
ncbi:hypothetical protein BDV96DRAFT_481139 [Lophiotrema nucula]|uniref:3-oxoacyl-[acyl-carrier-protein] reductase n=1 Tax=Lophiotrema nucula TaxID=690887 RepID=A0A6A5ZUM3_9PLEO|nr:hypothetical protein BDV96DRAFT_481139 [Lophiotrema nucula]